MAEADLFNGPIGSGLDIDLNPDGFLLAYSSIIQWQLQVTLINCRVEVLNGSCYCHSLKAVCPFCFLDKKYMVYVYRIMYQNRYRHEKKNNCLHWTRLSIAYNAQAISVTESASVKIRCRSSALFTTVTMTRGMRIGDKN